MNLKKYLQDKLGIKRPSEEFTKGFTATISSKDGFRGGFTFVDKTHEIKPLCTKDEWIWVTGYKGTDKDMKCIDDLQYELNKMVSLPEGEQPVICSKGFHFSLYLEDVFTYYGPEHDNRFFKVSALVRKKDYDISRKGWSDVDKLVAKSIILLHEVPDENVYTAMRKKYPDLREAPESYLRAARVRSIYDTTKEYKEECKRICIYTLIEDGYSEAFANMIVDYAPDVYELAHTVGTQKDLSMDMKCYAIFTAINNRNIHLTNMKRKR